MSTLTTEARDVRALRVNGTRLWDALMTLAQIGGTAKEGYTLSIADAGGGVQPQLIGHAASSSSPVSSYHSPSVPE